MRLRAFSFAVCIAGAACSGAKPPEPATAARAQDQRIPIGQLPDIDTDAVLAHTKTLSSDAFERRAPGSKGEQLTVNYLVEAFKQMGLEPGNTDGTYLQKVPLVGIPPVPAPLIFRKGAQQSRLRWKDDVVAWNHHVA